MAQVGASFVDALSKRATSGSETSGNGIGACHACTTDVAVELCAEMKKVTLDIIGMTAFGYDFDSVSKAEADPVAAAFTLLMREHDVRTSASTYERISARHTRTRREDSTFPGTAQHFLAQLNISVATPRSLGMPTCLILTDVSYTFRFACNIPLVA
jgi:hypothetical protein